MKISLLQKSANDLKLIQSDSDLIQLKSILNQERILNQVQIRLIDCDITCKYLNKRKIYNESNESVKKQLLSKNKNNATINFILNN